MTGTIETDPRYHPAFQRGYSGPPPERPREGEILRRPRRPGSAVAAPEPGPEVAPPPPSPLALDPALALGFDPEEGPESRETPTGEEPPQDEHHSALLGPAQGRRLASTLALSGVVLLVIGLLALWWNSRSWYDYSPSQETFGLEQYVLALAGQLSGPSLTVGLVVLCLAVLVQVVRAPRR